MSSFKELAQSACNNSSFICNKRETKVDVDDVITAYPDGITITEADLIKDGEKEYCVIGFAEDTKAFFFGGTVLTSIVKAWSDEYSGDCETMSKDLEKESVRVKLTKEKSKNGRYYTKVDVLD